MENNNYYATDAQANRVFDGIFKNDFKDWFHFGEAVYVPIGEYCGIERKNRNLWFHNQIDKNIYHIRLVDFATLDKQEYFLRLVLDDGELFIPIKR